MSPQRQRLGDSRKATVVPMKTTRKKATSEKHLPQYDSMTALPNRALFRQNLGKAMKIAAVKGSPLAVVFLALDPYSRINEILGPAMAGRLVRCVARRVKEVAGTGAVGYWGGDKFVLLLESPGGESEVTEIAQHIKKRIELRAFSSTQDFYLTLSVGIATFPLHGTTVETLLKNAGAALFEAQESGGNCCRVFTADLNARSLKRFTLETRLCRGLQRQQFSLHYQPQIDIASRHITGAEALIRWEHPDLGIIPPVEFIPVAEQSGLIVPIGEWVLRTACTQLKEWHDGHFPNLNLAINISARQFQDPTAVDVIMEILRETKLDPERLELELTETFLMTNAEDVIRSLGKLKAIGVKLATDDFGTGFSSMEYLRRLPLDTLKIDPSFVRDTATADGAALVSSIVALAHWLGLRVIAEGVETEEQLRFVQGLGCDGMQGYLFSRPLPCEQFQRLVSCADFGFEQINNAVYAFAAS